MNYQHHYDLLIERARGRINGGYTERHHIIPRCLGGTDRRDNLVRLTAEEHYLAHQLLVKMNPSHAGLASAAFLMTSTSKFLARNNKTYGWLRRRYAGLVRGVKKSPEATAKGAAKNRLCVRTQEFKDNVGEFHRGRKRPAVTGEKIGEAQRKRFENPDARKLMSLVRTGIVFSDQTKERLSISHRGKTASIETREKMSAAAKGKAKSPETIKRMSDAQHKWRSEKALAESVKLLQNSMTTGLSAGRSDNGPSSLDGAQPDMAA